MAQAIVRKEGRSIDYTPDGAVAGGAVIAQGGLVGVAAVAIPAGRLGALLVEGIVDVVKVAEEIAAGANVHWDADASPVVGAEDSGAATIDSTTGPMMGKAVALAEARAPEVRVKLERAGWDSVVIVSGAGAPTDGNSGTGAGYTGTGSLYVDVTIGELYINVGTQASPAWMLVGSQPS